MKRLLFIIISYFLCTVFSVYGQKTVDLTTGIIEDGISDTTPIRSIEENESGVTVTYLFNKATILADPLFPGRSFFKIAGFGNNHTEGEYSYVLRLDNIYVPTGKSASLELVKIEYRDLDIQLTPARRILLETEEEPTSASEITSPASYSGFQPLSPVMVNYEDENMIGVNVSPTLYNHSTGKLRALTKLVYRVNFSNSNKIVASQPSSNWHRELSNISLNPSACSELSTLVTPEGYIIITTPKFEDAVARLAHWKSMLGFQVEVSSKEHWTVSIVMNEIRRIYNQMNNPKYLLIVGDHEDVPAQINNEMDYWDNPNNTPVITPSDPSYYYPTDYFYSYIENVKYTGFPDLSKGRIPVSTANEASSVIDKIINYEINPTVSQNFYKNSAHAAYFESDSIMTNEATRFIKTSEDIRDYIILQNKNIKRIYYAEPGVKPEYYNRGQYGNGEPLPPEIHWSNFSWDGDSIDIINSINKGVFYILHRDHGETDRWSYPEFTSNSLMKLANRNMYPVVFNINCLSGKFSEICCFAEKFIRLKNAGCSGIVTASKESYSGVNDALTVGMFDAIWPGLNPYFKDGNNEITPVSKPIYRMGDVLNQGLIRMQEICPTDKNLRYQREIFHYFGDPSMMITTDTPSSISDVTIKRNGNQVSVTTSTSDVCISFYDNVTKKVSRNFTGNATFISSNPENVSVVISGHNKIPYIDTGNTSYTFFVQNQIINSDRKISAQKVILGKNVTDKIPDGEVKIDSGKMEISAKTVELRPGFTVTKGAQIEINSK